MSDFVYFYKNGNIINKNINLINGETISIFNDMQNVETINSKDIYYDKNLQKYYHKYTMGKSHTFLEWKKCKDNTWEWFKCIYNLNDLVSLDGTNIINNKELYEKKIKSEIDESIRIILSKYNYDHIKIQTILNDIKFEL